MAAACPLIRNARQPPASTRHHPAARHFAGIKSLKRPCAMLQHKPPRDLLLSHVPSAMHPARWPLARAWPAREGQIACDPTRAGA